MPNFKTNPFSQNIIDKSQFEQSVLVGIGRDLQLPQATALEQCRELMPDIYQLWSDGYSVEYTLGVLKELIYERTQHDPDLKWLLQDQIATQLAS